MSWLKTLTEKMKNTFGAHNYRAQLGSLHGIAIALLVVTVVVAVGSVILGGFYNSLNNLGSSTPTANSALNSGQLALGIIATSLVIVFLIVLAREKIKIFSSFGGREEV